MCMINTKQQRHIIETTSFNFGYFCLLYNMLLKMDFYLYFHFFQNFIFTEFYFIFHSKNELVLKEQGYQEQRH